MNLDEQIDSLVASALASGYRQGLVKASKFIADNPTASGVQIMKMILDEVRVDRPDFIEPLIGEIIGRKR